MNCFESLILLIVLIINSMEISLMSQMFVKTCNYVFIYCLSTFFARPEVHKERDGLFA